MIVPTLIFFIVLFIARGDLQLKGLAIWLGIWGGCLAVVIFSGIQPLYFVVVQVVLDIILLLILFGGDVRLRP